MIAADPHAMDDRQIIEVYDLRHTCIASPSQWEGRVGDHGSVYIRYRWGTLNVRLSLDEGHASTTGACVYCEQVGEKLAGYMETEEMQLHVAGMFHFNGPCEEPR
jgi:hypothetical protein